MTGTAVVRALRKAEGKEIGYWKAEDGDDWVRSALLPKPTNPDLSLAKFARGEFPNFFVSDIEHVGDDVYIIVLSDYDEDEYVVRAEWVEV